MKSMTGFGASDVEHTTSRIHIHIRAVNGRFLEPRFHLPKEFMSFESELRQILSSKVQRGTVDVFITRKLKAGPAEVRVNDDLALKISKSLKALSKKLGQPVELTSDALFQVHGIFSVEEDTSVKDPEKKKVIAAMKEAVNKLISSREKEGLSLKKDLTTHLKALVGLQKKMAAFKARANELLMEKFKTRLAQLDAKENLDPSRIAQEVTIQIDRSDIGEELMRLNEHLKNCLELLQSADAQGKRLDFYAQELLREVNTIGSKSQLIELTQCVVEAKTLIEKMREQVQNLE